MSCFRKLVTALFISLVVLQMPSFAEIEAVKGKRYTLTRQHGPWMIMVASIRDVEDEERRMKDGMTAWQAADELVYQLRKKGIPAYTYVRQTKMGDVVTASDVSIEGRQYIAQHGYISVLAGNFKDNQDDNLKKVLDYIKNKFRAEFLMDEKNGGIFARTPGRPGPLSKAFVTVNPLLSPEEVRQKSVDKTSLALNADMEYSLLKNKGKYTLVVATFTGNAITQLAGRADAAAMKKFEGSFGSNLDLSAEEAWSLTESLRNAKKIGYDQNYEAWLFHDRNKSVVTVGSFDSPGDPRIQTLATMFRAKPGRHPVTGEEMMTPEIFNSPRRPLPGKPIDRMWIFDADPHLMEVPRMK